MDTRRPGSFQLKKWGLVHGWLVTNGARKVEIEAEPAGLAVVVRDPELGAARETIGVDEDPSGAAWRAIARLTRGT